jgi:hypothetical protein
MPPGAYRTTAAGTPAPSFFPSLAPQLDDRRPMLTMMLLGAALMGIAVFAIMKLTSAPVAGTIHVTTKPTDAKVLLDGQQVGGSSSPFVLTEVSPSEPHELEVRRDGYVAWKTRLTLRSAQVVTLPPVELMRDPAAAPKPAPVAQPSATPAPAPSNPPPEPAKARAEEPAAAAPSAPKAAATPSPATPQAPAASKPRVAPKAPTEPAAPPRKATSAKKPAPAKAATPPPRKPAPRAAAPSGGGKGTLRINSRPWSNIYVDGRLVGNTPQMNLQLDAGRHTVTLVNPDFGLRKVLTVTIKPGEVAKQIVNLQ